MTDSTLKLLLLAVAIVGPIFFARILFVGCEVGLIRLNRQVLLLVQQRLASGREWMAPTLLLFSRAALVMTDALHELTLRMRRYFF